jgi:uncharacterized membrane protein (UPF0182 family)
MVAVSLAYLAVQVREFRRHSQVAWNRYIMENLDRVRSELPLSRVESSRFAAYLSQNIWTSVQLFENSPEEGFVPPEFRRELDAILATQSKDPAGATTSG